MTHKNEEFWVKRTKNEEEEFSSRIFDGLLDCLSEMEGEIAKVKLLEPKHLSRNRSESPQRMLTSLLKSEEVVRRPLGDVLQ
jgi:hypothetical protein